VTENREGTAGPGHGTGEPARGIGAGPGAGADPGPGAGAGVGPGSGSGLTALQRRLAEFAAVRRWQPYHTPKNLAIALSVEASELLEIFQWLTPEQAAAVMADEDTAHRVQDEVADVMAYLLQFCEVLGIDVLAALAAKIDRNELRFPRPPDGAGHSLP
jgi:NTP pyrophosphatase (non-canonical NTP hydrolase)